MRRVTGCSAGFGRAGASRRPVDKATSATVELHRPGMLSALHAFAHGLFELSPSLLDSADGCPLTRMEDSVLRARIDESVGAGAAEVACGVVALGTVSGRGRKHSPSVAREPATFEMCDLSAGTPRRCRKRHLFLMSAPRAVRSGSSSCFSRSALTSATMMSPTSSLTALKMPRFFMPSV
jgi:hypothetical protein